MRATSYARALHSALQEHPEREEKLLEQFISVVKGNGHAHLLAKIVRSLERILAKELKASTIEVTGAKSLSEEEITQFLKKEPFKHALTASHKRVERKVDASIIGGIIVRAGNTLIDGSYKRSLLDLYQRAVK